MQWKASDGCPEATRSHRMNEHRELLSYGKSEASVTSQDGIGLEQNGTG